MTPFIYSAPSYHLVIKSWQFKKLLPHYVFHLTQEISQTSCQLQNKVSFWFVIQAFHHHCSPAMKYFLPCNPFSLASDSLFLEYFNNTPVLCAPVQYLFVLIAFRAVMYNIPLGFSSIAFAACGLVTFIFIYSRLMTCPESQS